jgi:hypothetical protein
MLHGHPYSDIRVNESGLKNLRNILMKYSAKGAWHKGDYKRRSNAVEATMPDGTKQIVFQTTDAGYPTQDAVR